MIFILFYLQYIYIYLDLPTVTNVCLFIYKTSQKAEILHSWKIQVYMLYLNVIDTIYHLHLYNIYYLYIYIYVHFVHLFLTSQLILFHLPASAPTSWARSACRARRAWTSGGGSSPSGTWPRQRPDPDTLVGVGGRCSPGKPCPGARRSLGFFQTRL